VIGSHEPRAAAGHLGAGPAAEDSTALAPSG